MKTFTPGLILILFVFQAVSAQNLDNLGKEKPVALNGGISLNQVLYLTSDSNSTRQPYTYYLNGNLNFSLYGWSVPLSFTFSNRKFTFTQPFNQYSISPSYKWITLHAGYSSMTFSPYTLNGHQFLGAGIEMNPGKYRFSAMYGRMQKAIEYDTANLSAQPAYKRMGFGAKAGFEFDRATLNISVFHSKDEENSLLLALDTLEIYPEQNLTYGAGATVRIIDGLSLQAEYGSSVLIRDTRNNPFSDEGIFDNEQAYSQQFHALKGSVRYSADVYGFGITYERIDPGYRTHGAYYFNNDLENIAANTNMSLFKSKLNLAANVGVQKDDLAGKKVSNMLRVVSSFNAGFVPSEKINISATYSNFKSHTNIKSKFEQINQVTPYDNLDTLNFTQISQNTSLNFNYTISSTERVRKSFILNGMYQKASDIQQQVETNSGAKFLSLNAAYSHTLVKTNTSVTAAVNYNNSDAGDMVTQTVGPTINLRKAFADNKIRSSLSASYNNTYSNGDLINTFISVRGNAGYTYKKKHVLMLSVALINRDHKADIRNSKSTEMTATLGYSYNF